MTRPTGLLSFFPLLPPLCESSEKPVVPMYEESQQAAGDSARLDFIFMSLEKSPLSKFHCHRSLRDLAGWELQGSDAYSEFYMKQGGLHQAWSPCITGQISSYSLEGT